jgi:hypothetical protein
MSRQLIPRLAVVILLLLLAFLQISSLAFTSVTIDEPSHVAAGYAFLIRGDTRIMLNGPILPNALAALPLLTLPDLKLTAADDPMWNTNDHNGISDNFIWNNTASPFLLTYLSRLPSIFISWLLGALIFRWAAERAGAWAGVFALTLYVFDPNLLAHSRLAMTDFAPTAIACFALYAFDRWLRQMNSRKWLVTTGILVGLMLASKFSLIMFAFAMVILAVIRSIKSSRRISAFISALFIVLIAALTVWGVYAFQIGPIAPGGLPVPAPGFWRDWQSAQYYLNQPWPNYLFGQTSATGWWYYFPIALVLKTPLPLLILFVVAFVRTIVKRTWRADLIFLLPSLFLLISLLLSTYNLGYRYLLPILPLLVVYVSGLWPRSMARPLIPAIRLSPTQLALLVLLTWSIVGTLRIYPYYLTYFNEIAGGPDRGRYALSDSNIDWGQDLVGLKNYVEQNHLDQVKLSYFGIAHPTAYRLATQAIPPVRTAMHDQGAWWLKTYYPPDPSPGTYAISVANLMGGIWIDRPAYAFFRDRLPDTTIGNSIYVYTIVPRGASQDLSLAGLQIDQIDPQSYQRFATNDVRPRWFDATRSIITAPDRSWLAIADDQTMAPELAPLFDGWQPVTRAVTLDDSRSYALYHADAGARVLAAARRARQTAGEVQLPVQFGESAELIGFEINRAADQITLLTYWRAGNRVQTPLQLFVHALGPDGSIAAQEDRLDVPAYGWRAGDLFAQVNRVTLPDPAAVVALAVGFYDPVSDTRLPVDVNGQRAADQLVLPLVESSSCGVAAGRLAPNPVRGCQGWQTVAHLSMLFRVRRAVDRLRWVQVQNQ